VVVRRQRVNSAFKGLKFQSKLNLHSHCCESVESHKYVCFRFGSLVHAAGRKVGGRTVVAQSSALRASSEEGKTIRASAAAKRRCS